MTDELLADPGPDEREDTFEHLGLLVAEGDDMSGCLQPEDYGE